MSKKFVIGDRLKDEWISVLDTEKNVSRRDFSIWVYPRICPMATPYPLTRHVLNPEEVNFAYDIIEQNIYKRDGKLLGLKIFP